jgi:mycoredoxin
LPASTQVMREPMSTPKRLELYGSRFCPYTSELRDHLEWRGEPFIEYDVAVQAEALERLRALTGNRQAIPVLVEDGIVKAVGWQGRSCFLNSVPSAKPQ